MEQILKNKPVVIAGSVALLCFLLAMSSCARSFKLSADVNKGKSTVFDLEKEVNDLKRAKSNLESKEESLAQELAAEKAAHEATQKALLQEQLVNQSLDEQLQKITKLKEALEQDLRKALMAADKQQSPVPTKK